MKVLCILLIIAVTRCSSAPNLSNEDNSKLELFSGVVLEKDAVGEGKINVKFEPGELKETARTFEEARGKIKKYAPYLSSIGIKIIAIVSLLFGVMTVVVTKAIVVAKLAFLAASVLGVQKFLSSGSLGTINEKHHLAGYQASSQQWPSPSGPASYNYARSSIVQDGNDLAYNSQIPS